MSTQTEAAAVTRDRLDAAERKRLRALEAVIARSVKTFIESGKALVEIRDARLYREAHDTFEDYCRAEWGFNDSRARQLVGAGLTVTVVTADGLPAPTSERVARALAPLGEEPEAQRAAWRHVVDEHGDRPTAEQVTAIVRAYREQGAADSGEPGVMVAPPPPGSDLRFTRIENAANSLDTLPPRVAWPVEDGDVEAMDRAFDMLAAFMRSRRPEWQAHKAALKASRRHLRAA